MTNIRDITQEVNAAIQFLGAGDTSVEAASTKGEELLAARRQIAGLLDQIAGLVEGPYAVASQELSLLVSDGRHQYSRAHDHLTTAAEGSGDTALTAAVSDAVSAQETVGYTAALEAVAILAGERHSMRAGVQLMREALGAVATQGERLGEDLTMAASYSAHAAALGREYTGVITQ